MPLARNSSALKKPAWKKGVVNSVTFTMNRFARRAVLIRAEKRYPSGNGGGSGCIPLRDIATFDGVQWNINGNTTINEGECLIIPEATILKLGNFPNGSLTNNGTITVNGSIISPSTINNNSIINISTSGDITLNGDAGASVFNNNAAGIINNEGTLSMLGSNIGQLINNGTINNSGGTLIVDGVDFINNNTIYNPDNTQPCPSSTITEIIPITGNAPLNQCPP